MYGAGMKHSEENYVKKQLKYLYPKYKNPFASEPPSGAKYSVCCPSSSTFTNSSHSLTKLSMIPSSKECFGSKLPLRFFSPAMVIKL